ncbi:hypothetical protein Droror1_Dr00005149 [Drosera rotundifolia]
MGNKKRKWSKKLVEDVEEGAIKAGDDDRRIEGAEDRANKKGKRSKNMEGGEPMSRQGAQWLVVELANLMKLARKVEKKRAKKGLKSNSKDWKKLRDDLRRPAGAVKKRLAELKFYGIYKEARGG